MNVLNNLVTFVPKKSSEMNYVTYAVVATMLLPILASSQTLMVVEGSVVLGNDTTANPPPGALRFDGSDFQGWDGVKWISLSIGNVIENSVDGSGGGYPSLQIGSQVWMAKNLDTKRLNDGTDIDLVTDGTEWGGLSAPGMCYYQNGEMENAPTYGALYNWFAVETEKLCPVNWRVPGLEDWNILINYLGTQIAAGGALRATGVELWKFPNAGATNSSEFTGQPAGFRHDNGSFNSLTMWTYWWASNTDETNTDNSWYVTTGYGGPGINTTSSPKVWGLSVRCIRE